MTATTAPSAAPPYAVLMWASDREIYVEVPSASGPCVLRFPLTSIGLGKALALLRGRHTIEGHGEHYTAPLNPLAKRQSTLADSDDAIVRNILKRQGMLK